MKRISAILTFCLAANSLAYGQEVRGVCGMTVADQAAYTARLQENLAKVERGDYVSERGAIQYVPIHFHLVGNADGTGKHKERLVLDQLCDLNEAYAGTEMRFYLRPHPTYGLFDKSINNTNVYLNQTNNILMQNRKHQNAVNVFVVQEPATSNDQPGQTLGYYTSLYDWLVIRKSEINGTGNGTLGHEVGHYFSLRHTHYGWESDPFDPSDAAWPTAPANSPPSPYGIVPTERMNGTNCTTAADLICDTPPDYNFGFGWPAGNCIYNLPAKDPLGVQVNPMEDNFMGYFIGCDYVFTPTQENVILADRAASYRNYLDNNFVPAATVITTPVDLLVAPTADDTTQYYDEVLLEWQSVAGATYYLLEIDVLNSYSTGNYQSFVLTTTSQLLTNLQENRKYYWRVRPFNEYATCAAARAGSFVTSKISDTHEIKVLSAWQIAPNPVSNTARIFFSAAANFEATVSIHDATGRRVRTLPNTVFPQGESTLDLPVESLANGLYFVAIENVEGRAVRKMTIMR